MCRFTRSINATNPDTRALSAAGARLDAEHEARSQIGPTQAGVEGATARRNRNRIQVRRAKETPSSVHD